MSEAEQFAARATQEALIALLVGAATFFGLQLAQKLGDPYGEPRLTASSWLNRIRGGDASC